MPEDILENIVEGKVYTIRSIVISSFFGGLLASGFMLYQNFKVLGYPKKATTTILITIFGFILIMLTSLIPTLANVPALVYNVFITLLTSVLANRFQGSLVSAHLANGGKMQTTTQVVVICVITIVFTLALIFGIYYLAEMSNRS